MSFLNPHVRLLTVLLIVGILATALSNALTAMNNERILSDQKRFVNDQAQKTRQEVEEHANDTAQVLALIRQGQEQSGPVIESFAGHANQTATAVPIVTQNNELLQQILQELQHQQQGNDTRQ